MATTIQSRKAKGRRLQQDVVSRILTLYPELTERDVRSTPMGVSGADVMLSEKASQLFPFSVECKNQESISIWKDITQTESDTKERDLTPLLVIKRNKTQPYCVISLENFIKILEKCQDM